MLWIKIYVKPVFIIDNTMCWINEKFSVYTADTVLAKNPNENDRILPLAITIYQRHRTKMHLLQRSI